MQAIVNAINSNSGTPGSRVAAKLVQEGTSVLGVPFYYVVIGTPDNIANLDAGRDDQAFWRGVIDGTTSQAAALSQVDSRPAFAWITGAPHGNEPAGGESSVKELYELAARTDCDNAHRLSNLNEISHFALDLIQNLIGPSIQQTFNDQSSQYRNYNTYDLFVPEYGDTVPSLIMGGAGMTYEKGNNENYGKQVYDHYLAMDTTVNAVAEQKAKLMADWVKQWPEAVDQGQSCTVQDNTQVSPPVVDQYEIGLTRRSPSPPSINSGTSTSTRSRADRRPPSPRP
jgi:hypothetical protein